MVPQSTVASDKTSQASGLQEFGTRLAGTIRELAKNRFPKIKLSSEILAQGSQIGIFFKLANLGTHTAEDVKKYISLQIENQQGTPEGLTDIRWSLELSLELITAKPTAPPTPKQVSPAALVRPIDADLGIVSNARVDEVSNAGMTVLYPELVRGGQVRIELDPDLADDYRKLPDHKPIDPELLKQYVANALYVRKRIEGLPGGHIVKLPRWMDPYVPKKITETEGVNV